MNPEEACVSWLDRLFGSALNLDTTQGSLPVRPDTDFLDFEKRFASSNASQISNAEVAALYLDVTKRAPRDVYLSASCDALSELSATQVGLFESHVLTNARAQLLKTESSATLTNATGNVKIERLANLMFQLQQQRPAFFSQLLTAGSGPQDILRTVLANTALHAVQKAINHPLPKGA